MNHKPNINYDSANKKAKYSDSLLSTKNKITSMDRYTKLSNSLSPPHDTRHAHPRTGIHYHLNSLAIVQAPWRRHSLDILRSPMAIQQGKRQLNLFSCVIHTVWAEHIWHPIMGRLWHWLLLGMMACKGMDHLTLGRRGNLLSCPNCVCW